MLRAHPTQLPPAFPPPLLQKRRIGIQGEQGTCSGLTADSGITNPPPPPPGPEQRGCCGADGPKTLIFRPVPDTTAAIHLTVLHGGVVRREPDLGQVGWGRGGLQLVLSVTGHGTSETN